MTTFNPEDQSTWPIPEHAVLTRTPDGKPFRVSEYGDGWLDGFETALKMKLPTERPT